MQQKELPFRVIDKRNMDFYWTDREFLNGYAKYVGWQGQCVYHALCRHEKEGKCFPSNEHLAIELGISESSVKRGIKKLLEWNIVNIKKKRNSQGKWASNDYSLLDKSIWKKKPEQRWSNQRSNRTIAPEV